MRMKKSKELEAYLAWKRKRDISKSGTIGPILEHNMDGVYLLWKLLVSIFFGKKVK